MKKLIIFYYKYIYKWYLSVENTNMMDNHIYGRFKVRYPDGQLSQPFMYKTAKTYRALFGGNIIYSPK